MKEIGNSPTLTDTEMVPGTNANTHIVEEFGPGIQDPNQIDRARKRQLSFDADAIDRNVTKPSPGVGYKKMLELATDLCASITIQDTKTQEYFAGLLINMNETLSVKNPGVTRLFSKYRMCGKPFL